MRLSLESTRCIRNHALGIATLIWCGAFVITLSVVVLNHVVAVPYGEYVQAGRRFLAQAPLYDLSNIDGFQYLPPSALLFSLFARLGSPFGMVAWCFAGWSAYAFGMWRLGRVMRPARTREAFLLATALAVGPAVGNLVNGQANLLLAALSLHVVVELGARRFWRASALLAFGVGLKPLMLVLLLLTWALYRPMVWRLPLALLPVLSAPWLFRDHAYVMQQYADCLQKLRLCSNPDRQFEDLRGLLSTLGWLPAPSVYVALRAAAALGVLATCARVRAKTPEPVASFSIAAFAAAYLMLFNPRTLSSSYVMTGSFAALLAAGDALDRHKTAWLMLAILLAWTLNHNELPFVELWLRPLACIGFCAVLFYGLRAGEAASAPTKTY